MEGVADSVSIERMQPAQRRADLSVADVGAARRRRAGHQHQLDARVRYVAIANEVKY